MNQQRAELLAGIAQLGERYPNWRLGQLVANVAGWADQEIWDVEDRSSSMPPASTWSSRRRSLASPLAQQVGQAEWVGPGRLQSMFRFPGAAPSACAGVRRTVNS
jgi:hypothetical protein